MKVRTTGVGCGILLSVLSFSLALESTGSRSEASTSESADGALQVELSPLFSGSVVDYGDSLTYSVSISNQSAKDLAVCWSSLPDRQFLSLRFLQDERVVRLNTPEDRARTDYYFDRGRDIVILPGGSRQFSRIQISTAQLPDTGECTTYKVQANYWCPKSAQSLWERDPRLVVGEVHSSESSVTIDDRSFLRQIVSGPC